MLLEERVRFRAHEAGWRRGCRRGVGEPPGGEPARWGASTLGLSYAKAFAAGAVPVLECPVLSCDPEFRVAEETGVAVRWLGRWT